MNRRCFLVGTVIATLTLVMLGMAFLFFLASAILPRPEYPQARQGVIDLRSWNFPSQGLVPLTGEWEIYPGKLATPSELEAVPLGENRQWLWLPSPWGEETTSADLSRRGIATYRLRVLLPKGQENFGISLINIRMASKIFVDGVLLGQGGSPAASLAEGYRKGNYPYEIFFASRDREVVILLQVANLDFKDGGVIQELSIGQPPQIVSNLMRRQLLNGAIVFSILITGLYFLFIYFGHRRELSFLLYGSYSILFALFESTYGEKLLMRLLGEAHYGYLFYLNILALFGSNLIICYFFWLMFGRIIPRWFLAGATVWLSLAIATLLILPMSVFSDLENLFLIGGILIYWGLTGLLIYGLARGIPEEAKRIQAWLMLMAICGINLYYINGFLYFNAAINTQYVGIFGQLIYIVCISIMLIYRFTHSYVLLEAAGCSLQRMNQLKDEFLTNASRQLRSPVNGMINLTQAVLTDAAEQLTEQQQENLQFAIDAGNRISSLVEDILDLALLRRGELQMQPRPIDLRSVTEIVLRLQNQQLGNQLVRLHNAVPPEFPLVMADPRRLRQIVDILVDNAIKYAASGNIEVGAEVRAGGGVFWVQDQGPGIDPEVQQGIFDAFYRGEKGRNHWGTGLGLAIAKGLIEAQQGNIELRSLPGQGTRFIVSLPLAPTVLNEREEVLPQELEHDLKTNGRAFATTPPQADGAKVLLADDDVDNLRALQAVLLQEGYQITAVTTGEQALAEIQGAQRYDLAILEIMLPTRDGYALLPEIRRRFSLVELPVLFLTTTIRPEELRYGFQAGVNDYIIEPFAADELRARVATLLALRQAGEALVQKELLLLQAQIKPHFIYNSISVIASLSTRDPQRAKELLLSFADYLRGSFRFEDRQGMIPLKEELITVGAYLELEQARFKHRLSVVWDVEEGLDCLLPVLVIQPLVENAVFHGVRSNPDQKGTVTLRIWRQGEWIHVEVIDDGRGMDAETVAQIMQGSSSGTGLALKNINQRLQKIYGRGLLIESSPSVGTKVVMELPTCLEGSGSDAGNGG